MTILFVNAFRGTFLDYFEEGKKQTKQNKQTKKDKKKKKKKKASNYIFGQRTNVQLNNTPDFTFDLFIYIIKKHRSDIGQAVHFS